MCVVRVGVWGDYQQDDLVAVDAEDFKGIFGCRESVELYRSPAVSSIAGAFAHPLSE